MTETQTWIHPVKCLACQLHFNVYSDNEHRGLEWTPSFCPECGAQDTFLEYPAKPSEHFIFEFVPGTFEGMPKVPPLPRMQEQN